MAAYHDGRRLCDDAKLAAAATEQERNGQPAPPARLDELGWYSESQSCRWGGVLELIRAASRAETRLGDLCCCNERPVVKAPRLAVEQYSWLWWPCEARQTRVWRGKLAWRLIGPESGSLPSVGQGGLPHHWAA